MKYGLPSAKIIHVKFNTEKNTLKKARSCVCSL